MRKRPQYLKATYILVVFLGCHNTLCNKHVLDCKCVHQQEMIVDPYLKRLRSETNRHLAWQKQNSSQQMVVLQHWRSLRRHFTNERGAWANRYPSPPLPAKTRNKYESLHLNSSLVSCCQSSTRGQMEAVQRWDVLKDAPQTRAQLQLRRSLWGQCPQGQHGYETDIF